MHLWLVRTSEAGKLLAGTWPHPSATGQIWSDLGISGCSWQGLLHVHLHIYLGTKELLGERKVGTCPNTL